MVEGAQKQKINLDFSNLKIRLGVNMFFLYI